MSVKCTTCGAAFADPPAPEPGLLMIYSITTKEGGCEAGHSLQAWQGPEEELRAICEKTLFLSPAETDKAINHAKGLTDESGRNKQGTREVEGIQ